MPKINPKLLGYFGVVLTLLSFGFVFSRSKLYLSMLPVGTISLNAVLFFVGLGILYGAAEVLLAIGWRRIAKANGVDLPFRTAVGIWGVTQIAKYIPGNVFHIASKQVSLARFGVKQKTAAVINGTELGLMAISGLALAWWAMPVFLPWLNVTVVLIGFAFTMAILLIFVRKFSSGIATAFLLQTAFMIITGCLFTALIGFFGSNGANTFPDLVIDSGIYIVSWLAGFVTPGASAGLGIRESVLLLLGSRLPEGTLAISGLVMRLVSIIGDLIIFGVSLILRRSVGDEL